MLGAVAGHPAGTDLAPLGDELAQHHDVLVVDVLDPVLAEDADLPLLLLLPGLLFLFLPRRSLLGLRGHPVASPRPNSGLRRPGREPWPTSRRRPCRLGARSWPWPTAGSAPARRPRSRPPTAARPPGSPRSAGGGGPRRPPASPARGTRRSSRPGSAKRSPGRTRCRRPSSRRPRPGSGA